MAAADTGLAGLVRPCVARWSVCRFRPISSWTPVQHGNADRNGPLSVVGAILDAVDVSAEAVVRIPGENVRVSRAEFGKLWARAEYLGGQPASGNEYLVGVVWTCRWLAGQPVWSPIVRRWEMPPAPLTTRRHAAMPETIDAEYMAAVTARPFERELARGVVATLDWTWHGSRRPPLDLSSAAAAERDRLIRFRVLGRGSAHVRSRGRRRRDRRRASG